MKKIGLILIFLLVLTIGIFAESVFRTSYENKYGLEVKRVMKIVSEDRIDIIRGVQVENFHTNMTIVIENNEIPKEAIEIKERIKYLPEDAKFEYGPEAEEKENRLKWTFENVENEEKLEMWIYFEGKLDEELFEELESPVIEIEMKKASLIIPSIGRIGDEMLITAVTEDNEALQKIKIKTISPSGKEDTIITDEKGVARITPQEEGEYVFELIGFETDDVYSVEIEPLQQQGLITAQISNGDSWGAVDFIPIVIALIIIAVVLFGMVVYFIPKKEGELKPEDFEDAFNPSEESEGPEWMKDGPSFFSERTIENESTKPKLEKKPETSEEKFDLKVVPKPVAKAESVKKESTDKVAEIKARTKKIVENRKKISAARKIAKIKVKKPRAKEKKKTVKKRAAKKTTKKKTAKKRKRR